MPNNPCEALEPRNKLSSDPSPLIQLDGKPIAPEVSVLLDKEIVQLVGNKPSSRQNKDGTCVTHYLEQTSMNQKESYSAWKAKNDQIFSSIRIHDKPQDFSKPSLKSRNFDSLRETNIDYDIIHCSAEDNYISPSTSKELKSKKKCSSIHEHNLRHSEDGAKEIYNCDNRYADCENLCRKHFICENGQLYNKSKAPSQTSGNHIICNGTNQKQENHLCMPIEQNSMRYNSNHPFVNSYIPCCCYSQEKRKMLSGNHNSHTMNNTCQCGVQSTASLEKSTANHNNKEQTKLKEKKHIESQPVSALDLTQINSKIIDLQNVIHNQNEQILMLKQQILEIDHDCLNRFQQNFICQKCLGDHNCGQESDRNILKEKCPDYKSGVGSKRSIGVMTIPVNNVASKRSVGVMTVPLRYGDNQGPSNSHTKRDNKHVIEPMKHQNSEHTNGSLLQYQDKRLSQRKITRREEGKKIKTKYESAPTSSRIRNKGKSKSIRRENSFSWNEADILIRTSVEQDDMSPNNSVHVEMHEYYSSSTESNYSDTSESVTEEDSHPSSDVEVESTGPQFGHTFYNLVVDQVNKIVQPTAPRQDPMTGARRIMSNRGYEINEEYGTENNWSKRVTFDGPPLEDSDNQVPNTLQVPRSNQQKNIQDFGMPDRMKDFLLYNIADGSTNMSIASLRYLERYNMHPSQYNTKNTGPITEEQPFRKQKKKKKKKFSIERDSDAHQPFYNRKVNATSSKLLDITALKQQPKLF